MPCLSYPALAGGLGAFWGAFKAGNRFDRQAAVLDALGLGPAADPARVLRL